MFGCVLVLHFWIVAAEYCQHYSPFLHWTGDKLQGGVFFKQRRKEMNFCTEKWEGGRESRGGPLAVGGFFSGRISKCKQTTAHS